MGRKRALSRNLIELKADFRFEPYTLLIDESDLAEGSIAGEDGETKNVVEHLLRSRERARLEFRRVLFRSTSKPIFALSHTRCSSTNPILPKGVSQVRMAIRRMSSNTCSQELPRIRKP